jgi:hypothetical protein
VIAESPWLKNWSKALDEKFGQGDLKKNLAAFEAEVAKLPSGNASDRGTQQWYARTTYDGLLSRFLRLELYVPSFLYTGEQIAEIEGGRIVRRRRPTGRCPTPGRRRRDGCSPMNIRVKVVADNTAKPVTVVFPGPRGMCSCGWIGKARWTVYGARIDAELHRDDTGHGLADPLVLDS